MASKLVERVGILLRMNILVGATWTFWLADASGLCGERIEASRGPRGSLNVKGEKNGSE
jgi:hypothetical protein